MNGFKEWYTSEVGISPDEAKERGVYDVDIMAKCWQAATERAAGIAETIPFTMSMFLRKEECKAAVNAQKVIAAAIRKG